MDYTKIFFLFVFLFPGFFSQNIHGQANSIDGDTILLNMEAEVQIVFPTPPTNYRTEPAVSQYRIWSVKTGIYLIPGMADYTPVTLLVSEGGRDHRFILQFKQDISNSEAKLYYDYSTLAKLAQHSRGKSPAGTTVSKTPPGTIKPVENDAKEKVKVSNADTVAESSVNYYALLERAEKEFRAQNYGDAALSFNIAHTLRPADEYPVQRLEEIKNRVAVNPKMPQGQQVTIENTEKKTTVNVVQAEKEPVKKPRTVESNYDIMVKLADSLFKNGNYDSAKGVYNKVLVFSKRPWPREQLNKINKILNDRGIEENKRLAEQLRIELSGNAKNNIVLPVADKKQPGEIIPAEEEKQMPGTKPTVEIKPAVDIMPAENLKASYTAAMANGKASYLKNDLEQAKAFYEEALRLQPSRQEPASQLKVINNKLEEIAAETELNNSYDRAIALADSLVNAKALDSAVISYKAAAALKPMEYYPKKQLKYMQSELALLEKKRKEEKERHYVEVLALADKAVADKKYDEALPGYTEALAIHPENEYAKRRLQIISYQVEKIRLEKLSQDTIVKEVVPVKKTRRRKN